MVLKPLGLPAPVIEPQDDGSVLLRPVRGGRRLVVRADGPLDLGGVVVAPVRGQVSLAGVPAEGVRVRGPVTRLVEITDGLPRAVAPWAELRSPAVPVHEGDVTIVHGQ
jgi:hypothetical protein